MDGGASCPWSIFLFPVEEAWGWMFEMEWVSW